jgi:hypothetical protein
MMNMGGQTTGSPTTMAHPTLPGAQAMMAQRRASPEDAATNITVSVLD